MQSLLCMYIHTYIVTCFYMLMAMANSQPVQQQYKDARQPDAANLIPALPRVGPYPYIKYTVTHSHTELAINSAGMERENLPVFDLSRGSLDACIAHDRSYSNLSSFVPPGEENRIFG